MSEPEDVEALGGQALASWLEGFSEPDCTEPLDYVWSRCADSLKIALATRYVALTTGEVMPDSLAAFQHPVVVDALNEGPSGHRGFANWIAGWLCPMRTTGAAVATFDPGIGSPPIVVLAVELDDGRLVLGWTIDADGRPWVDKITTFAGDMVPL